MFNSIMNNGLLRYRLIEFNRAKMRGNSTYIYLDPTINIRGIYIFYIKNKKYYKLHYLYLYYIRLSTILKLCPEK